MKILFDHQTFTLQEFGGISRYFYEINKQLKSFPDVKTDCSLFLSNNEYLTDDVIPARSFLPAFNFKGKRRIMLAINKLVSMRRYEKVDYDIFHPTYYDPYYLSKPRHRPIVITCLDLIHEKYITDDALTIKNKKQVLSNADKILAISYSTKNDLMDYYNIPEERITVTHLASSLTTGNANVSDQSLGREIFFLYVGARNLYKNFPDFVRALAPLLQKRTDLFLYCAGGGKFDPDELSLFIKLKIADKVKIYSGSNESLRKLYSSAIAFFYPSLYEGFGIPILEAMNCGCPVATSNGSSLPEVAGNAALYFDPLKKEEILSVAESLLSNDELRLGLIQKGYLRAKEFSWKKTAQETYLVYKALL